ncbi:MAG: hypothetical protein P8J87_08215, partial [Verrucomicrobiales bacterium]|nr:hypothetical protein [Verrucomicrobiales bacterium]
METSSPHPILVPTPRRSAFICGYSRSSALKILSQLLLLLTTSLSAAPPSYNSDIAPLLRQYCAGCHNNTDFEGDFSVETFTDFKEGGSKGNPIGSGSAEATLLMRQLTGDTKKPMPPKDEPQLSPDEIATFHAWVAAGAHGPAEDISILSTLTVPQLPPSKSESPITALATSPDNSKLALAWSNSIRIATANPDIPVLENDALPGKVNAVHFSPNGKRFVAATGIAGLSGTAIVWDLHTGKRIAELGAGTHRDVLYDAEFSPDGQTLATAGYDRKIALWSLATGKLTRTIDVHNGAVFDLAFSPDGTVLASASADQTVKLWLVETGERLDTLNQPEGEQLTITFTPDGNYIIAAGADKRIRMWRFVSKTTPALNPLLHARFAHEAPVTGLALSPDGRTLVSTSDDLTLKSWSLPDLILTKTFPAQPDLTSDLTFTGPTTFTTARLDGTTTTFANPPNQTTSSIASSQNSPTNTVPFAPRTFTGAITEPGQAALHPFPANSNAPVILEINAARSKSPLDSKIEILDAGGQPVPQVKLQAVRDSWLTFRGKDSTTSDDFRVHNWEDMELDEFLYVNGEVVRLWLYPRGPDSGFKVYPGAGNRKTYFATTALSHPLGQPCSIVRPFAPDVTPPPNGLPVYTLYYENDDDPTRRRGSDSFLIFTPPADGNYQARITDTRGFAGEDFNYTLTVRPPAPDFTAKVEGASNPAISPGSGSEFALKIDRTDGFEGPVTIDITGL